MEFIDDLRAITARQKTAKTEAEKNRLANWVEQAAKTISRDMKEAAFEGADDYDLSVDNITDEQKEAIKRYYAEKGFDVKENTYCVFGENKTYLDISWAEKEK